MNYSGEDIWYPSIEYIDSKHSDILEENPDKYPGKFVDPVNLLPVLHQVRATPEAYRKAAVLFKEISRRYVYEDANTTTAIPMTIDLLSMNSKEFALDVQDLTAKVGNNHGYVNIGEIADFLKDGDINEEKLQ